MEEKGKDSGMVLKLPTMRGIVVLLVSMTFVLVLLATPAAAQPVKVWVNAPEYVEEGATFVTTTDVDNITNFNMGLFDLSFESSVVDVKDVTAGSIDDTGIPIIMWRFLEGNTIRVMMGLSGTTTVSGSGYLAKISFEVVGKEGDESVLNLSEGVLGNNKAEEIPAEWIDAEITVVTPSPTPTPTPTPSPTPTPTPTPTPVTIYVPDDYPTVQSAVDNATAGDTIIVRDGNYTENVDVNKRLTIQSENGPDLTTIRAANPREHVFEVTANHCKIIGFTVKGERGDGIHLHGANYCNIADNNLSNNWAGIYLYDSSNNIIAKNNVSSSIYGIHSLSSSTNTIKNNIALNNDVGISLDFASSNNIIVNNDAKSNNCGIFMNFANNNTISDNNISNNWIGIDLWDSNFNMVKNNNISNNVNGTELLNSNYNRVENNNISKNKRGIKVHHSSNNTINSNNISNNMDGIYIHRSSKNVVENNTFVNDGLFVWESYNNKIENNTVNGKPLVYLEEVSDYRVEDAGQVILVKCANISAENLDLSSTNVGIELFKTCNSKIISNNASSSNRYGIYLYLSNDNLIKNNNASNNEEGIYLDNSSDNTVTKNAANANTIQGVYLSSSSSNTVLNNNINSNNKYGIHFVFSNNNVIKNNTFVEDGLFVEHSYENIVENNSVNGKPLVYLENSSYHKITDAGQVILLNCENITAENLNLSATSVGVELWETNNGKINNSSVSNNFYGIYLWHSRDNKICINNFINNRHNVYSYKSTNIWNSTSPIQYTYNGHSYTNYMGNYWSNYEGEDVNKDGIGDTPYRIGRNMDNYPLMDPWQNYFPEENEAKENTNPKLAFSSYYHPINISVNLSVPPYHLPLNLSNVTNINEINAEFWLTEREKELLRNNGFVIIDYGQEDDIVSPYEDMKVRDIPIFVTTDTLLHLYHIQFNEILKGIEEREFFDELVDMSNAMLEQSIQDYENVTDPEMKEAARRNVAYFAVALKLLQTPTEGYNGSEDIKGVNFTIPDYVKDDVDKEIENIEQHDGPHPSVIFNSDPNCLCGYPCCYCEDYSQYVPRGHYTRSEKLKRYFNAMMWYGRMAFLLKGGDEALISEQDAKISTIQAALISSELPDVTFNNKTAQEIWDRIYSVTAFFVGTADDLTPYEYRDAINNVFGAEYNVSELSTEDNLLELKVELARLRSPEIYGGSGVCVVYPPITKEKLYKCLNKTKGMRFMGQRFVPDSYMFDQLVSPAVGMYVGNDTPFTMCITDAGRARCFPRGLDIMAVLGSERAEDILIEEGDTEYAGINTSYDKQLEELKSQFAGFDITEWNRNLYWSWLYTLKPLLKQFGDGYPTFMQTRAWQEKELQTSLASWTELRHDTILYAKQSYTPPLLSMPPQPKPVRGYMEPVPEFYARLLALTKMTENGLIDLDVLNKSERARLQSLERILERLINISKAELENKELNDDDYEFIRNFGERLDSVVAGVNTEGKETTIVADVHTDCNTGKVLEEGVGYVNLILVAYNVPDGRIIIGAGPVFSYYEFKHPMDDRLTDEKWKEMLESNPPEKPEWVGGIGVDG